MLFKNVIGQFELKRKLIQSVLEGRVAHAQMLVGRPGSGPLPLALAFAQYLNCEQKSEEDSCGICPSCLKSAKMAHPDIHYSYPFIASKADKKELSTDLIKEWRETIMQNPYLTITEWTDRLDAANKQMNIPVGECRSIISKLNLKTYEAPFKVMVLWLPEYLGKEGNTLLKIIEEPPDDTVFLFVAEDTEKILNTILSRTQIMQVGRLSDDEVEQYLVTQLNVPTAKASSIAPVAVGDVIEAKSLLNEQESNYSSLFIEWMRMSYIGIAQSKPDQVVNLHRWIENFSKIGRENQKNFLLYCLHMLRQLMVLGETGEGLKLFLEPERDFANKFTRFLNIDRIGVLMELFDNAHYHIERNANPKILFMHLSISVARVLNGKQVISTIEAEA